MSAKNFMIGLENLQKQHDLIGNGQKIYSHAKTFKDSASTCLKAVTSNPDDPNALKAMVGIDNKETVKLLDTMAKLQKLAEETVRTKFPEVTSARLMTWGKWITAIHKHGNESRQAQTERKYYMKSLKSYDSDLGNRIAYCKAVNNVSDRHIKTYGGVEAVVGAGIDIADKLLTLPEMADVPYHAEALRIILKYQSLPPAAKRVVKAHQALKPVISAHQKHIEKVRKENAVWLGDMKKADLSKRIKDAFKSAGIKL